RALRCAQSWVQYGIRFSSMGPLVERVISLLPDPEIFQPATEVLIELVASPSMKGYEETLCNKLVPVLTSGTLRDNFARAVSEEDEHGVGTMCRLLIQIGDTYTGFLVRNFVRPDVAVFIEMMIACTGFGGYFPAEQEITDLPLQFWSTLACSITEAQVPETLSTSSSIDKLHVDPVTGVPLMQPLPPADTAAVDPNRPAADRARSAAIGNTYATVELDATLWCIKAIAEEVSGAESVHVPRMFGPEFMGRLASVPPRQLTRVKRTALLTIGEYAEWLRGNHASFETIVPFVIACIRDPELSTAAVTGLHKLCDCCRHEMVQGVDLLVEVWPVEKALLVKGVSCVIQVLPPDALLPRLISVLHVIVRDTQMAMETLREDHLHARESILEQLALLKACCQGIGSTLREDEEPVIIDPSLHPPTPTPTHPPADADQQRAVSTVMWEVTERICSVWGGDEEVMQALCDFIEKTLAAGTILPIFTPNIPALVHLLVAMYRATPFACFLKAAA
ncbi:hypothetical protein BDK51DRAFT_13419, partial [Blyttiomyces helicus]